MRSALVVLALLASACGGDSSPDASSIDADLPKPGKVHFTWTIADSKGPSTCEAVGATTVALRLSQGPDQETQAFNCADGEGTTNQQPPANYFAEALLLDTNGSLYDSTLQSVSIDGSGATVEMMTVEFVVEPPGSFTMKVDAVPEAAGNCVPKAMGGAGITGMTLSGSNTALGGCITRDMAIGAGPTSMTPEGTYAMDCVVEKPSTPCLENDQSITLGPLPPGSYRFEVTGWRDDTKCFSAIALVDIESGQVTDKGVINFSRNMADPACG
jgi:hypothetical protein